jgi:26S proteasome regulatory subunit T3
MNLSPDIDLEHYVQRPHALSAAEIASICQAAGLHAVRNNRYVLLNQDLDHAYAMHTQKAHTEFNFYA